MTTQYFQIAKDILGLPGAMVSWSKTFGPPAAIYNARIIVSREQPDIWNGDIDIFKSREQLLELSKHVGKLYVLPEHGSSIYYDALVIVENGKIWIDDNFVRYIIAKPERQKRMMKRERELRIEEEQKVKSDRRRAKKAHNK